MTTLHAWLHKRWQRLLCRLGLHRDRRYLYGGYYQVTLCGHCNWRKVEGLVELG